MTGRGSTGTRGPPGTAGRSARPVAGHRDVTDDLGMGTTSELLAGTGPERVATGAVWAEGPVWWPERRVVLFSDVRGNKVFAHHVDTGEQTVHREPSGHTNGRTLDRDGAVVQCSHGRRLVERETADGEITVLTERWAGGRYNSPNDLVVRRDGTIWFTDPSYGITMQDEGHPGELEYGDHFVFRLDPSDGTVTVVVSDVEAPNGLAFSRDESLLYVADSSALAPDGHRPPDRPGDGNTIRVYDVHDGRRAKNGRHFATVEPGIPDGIRVDEHGNVWSSSGDGVHVFSPAGEHVAHVPVPETVANLCFGGDDGRTLYITATTSLYRIATTVRDAAHLPS